MGRSALVGVAGAAVVSACGSAPPSLRLSDYERNCGASTDCVPVAVATQCKCPLCNNVGINRVDLTKYDADRTQYESQCRGTACTNVTCPSVTAYCAAGTCQVQ
jgi:hypothetical protein